MMERCFSRITAVSGDGVVVKGRSFAIPSIRVDSNDALAVYTLLKGLGNWL